MFVELEGEMFAKRIAVQACLTEGFQTNVFQAKRQTHMLYWSVQIVESREIPA